MLPILDFESLADDTLINLDLVIEALKATTFIKIDRNLVFSIEERVFNEGEWIIQLAPNMAERMLNDRLQLNYEPIKISKKDTLRLFDIIKKQEKEWEEERIEAASKPTKELVTTKIKPPEVEREGKAYSFINACFHSYKGKPSSLDELIRYCEEKGAVGYTEIKIDGTDKRSRKVKCNEHKEGITWASLTKVYRLFLKEQD